MTALIISMVVMGIYTFIPGRLITISPGNLPRGILLSQGQHRPMAIMIRPMMRRFFCMPVV